MVGLMMTMNTLMLKECNQVTETKLKGDQTSSCWVSEVIECADGKRGHKYVQSWENNMGV